ncbi:tetratricopeptide repeat protein [Candidatus Uabimicrobium sp. HlEnr_7]|uniref:tetratricopeptide repeat protein n=1 Tax=Candidatus Uabimicrobium helgolandensis TaxID=3095367 RepID=UPI003557D919
MKIFLIFMITITSSCSFLELNPVDKSTAQNEFTQAQKKYDEKNLDEALILIDAAIEHDVSAPNFYELRAFILLGQLKWQDALDAARTAHSLDSSLIKPYFFEAANYLLYGQFLSAAKEIHKVKILHPNYEFNNDENLGLLTSYWRELLTLYEKELPESGDLLLDEALKYFPRQNFLLTMKGHFSLEKGAIQTGKLLLEKAIIENPYSLRTVKLYRRFLLQNKQYATAYNIWLRIVPQRLVFHEDNKVRLRYLRLQKAIKSVQENNNESLLELARSLTFVGWEEEAVIVYDQVTGFDEEKQKLQNHIQFLKALRKYVAKYYQTTRRDIVTMLSDIRRIAATFSIDLPASPSREFQNYFWVVREANPFNPKAQTLCSYFARYNKFFDMGNNYGQIEIRLMNRLCHRTYQREIWGKPRTYQAITCDETFIDSYSGYFSGAPTIAGRAFLSNNGFYVAVDTLRPHIVTLQDLYKRITQPVKFPEKFSMADKDYLPYSKSIADIFLKRALRKQVKKLPKTENEKWDTFFNLILERRLDTVHNHELGHINDLPCYMPIQNNIGRHLGLLWKQGFSPNNIQTRFEHVAELFGVRHTKYIDFYLFQVMERLDASFEGIFTMVYWAWYGRLPSDDPYYKSASRIYRGLMKLSGKENDWQTLKDLTQYNEKQLRKWVHELCAEQDITKRCDCE